MEEHNNTASRVVVVGGGMVANRFVEAMRARDVDGRFHVTVLADEPRPPYDRVALTSYFSGRDPRELNLGTDDLWKQPQVKLRMRALVTGVDRMAGTVTLSTGEAIGYDHLVLATGSYPFVPPVRGSDLAGSFVYRTIDDVAALRGYVETLRGNLDRPVRGAVIGGGLLGLEAARGLLTHGCEVHLVHLGKHLMEQQCDAEAAAILRRKMEAMGVTVHLEKSTTAVTGEGPIEAITFKDGSTLACDLLVVAAGIRPNAEIGLRCGLTVERAIVTDDQMRSIDDPNVYIVGECAQHRGRTYGLVAPLWEQAKVFADHITGKNAKAAYHGSKLATKLKVMGVELASMGITMPASEEDEVVTFSEPRQGTYKKLIVRDGRLVGGIMMGDLSKVAYLMQAFDRNTPLPEERLSLLFDIGAPAEKVTLDEMPGTAQVCNCNGVTKDAIGACVAAGKRTGKAVMEATRAGMGCGACKALVSEVVEFFCDGEVEEDPSIHYYVPNIPMTKPELMAAVRERGLRSVSAVLDAFAERDEPAAKIALASMLTVVWKGEYVDERDARFINDRVHGNIQKDGTFSVVPEMPGGITNPDELRRIADVAEKYQVPLVKLTGGQRIDLVGIPKDQLPAVWRELGMPAGYAWGKSYRTCKSCIGTDFCRFGLGDSMGLATEIEGRFRGLDSPGKLKLATAGCPRNCSEAMVKDVGAVAVGEGRWEIYVGGAAGAHIRKGDVLCTVDSHEAVLRMAGRFMQYYRENAKYKERTYTFVERLGIARIRAIVVEDAEGIAADLDRAMQASVEQIGHMRDPWREGQEPATANQFKTLIAAE